MKVLVLSDGHGNVKRIDEVADRVTDADFVVFGGDFAAIGDPETGLPYLERLAARFDRLFAVTGNADEPLFRETLEAYDVSVEGSLCMFEGLVFAGSGGSTRFMDDTPNEREEADILADLDMADEAGEGGDEPWNNLIVVAHNPPKDTKLDAIGSGAHVGSALIRDFLERHQPLLAISGHIHESFAVDTLGSTTLLNPGSLDEGRYAIVEISGGKGKPYRVESVSLETL